jgi:hypothetical protein
MTSTVITSYYDLKDTPKINWKKFADGSPLDSFELLELKQKKFMNKIDITTDEMNYVCNTYTEFKQLLLKYKYHFNEEQIEHLNVFRTVNAPFNEQFLREEEEERIKQELYIQKRKDFLQKQKEYFEEKLSSYEEKLNQCKNDSLLIDLLQKAIKYYKNRINGSHINHFRIHNIGPDYIDYFEPDDNNNDDECDDTNTNNGDDI